MTIVFEATRYRFEPDLKLTALVCEILSVGPSSIQDIIDFGRRHGFDCRASAMEVGIMLMDKVIRPSVPTSRLSGSTVVEATGGRRPADSSMQH